MILSLSRKDSLGDITIQELYNLLAVDERRNELIIDDVLMAMEEGRSPILLTERKKHLKYLHDLLQGFDRHIVILRGGRPAKYLRHQYLTISEKNI
jgi:hypothetical protein